MRVKSFYPADTPVPPQTPEHLRQEIHWYASMLFKAEADQYDQFRSDVRYKDWLSGLADRTRVRVMKALDNLESNGTSLLERAVGVQGALILGYHGLTTQEVEKDLRTMLSELCDQYEHGIAPGQSGAAVLSTHTTPSRSEKLEAAEPTRESLAEQITLLKEECDITAEAIAKAVKIEPRSVFKHLAGDTMPRRQHAAAYEKLFSIPAPGL